MMSIFRLATGVTDNDAGRSGQTNQPLLLPDVDERGLVVDTELNDEYWTSG